jgi:hypothetical protein
MKFSDYFNEPQHFTDESCVISGEYSREKAAELIAEEMGDEVLPEDLKEDRVRFGFPPESVVDCYHADGAIWYTGASGVGSKSVWVLKG